MSDGEDIFRLHGSESEESDGEVAARQVQRRQALAAAVRRSEKEANTRGRYLHLVDAPVIDDHEFYFYGSSPRDLEYTFPNQERSVLSDPWHLRSDELDEQLGLSNLSRRPRTLGISRITRAARSGGRIPRVDCSCLTSFIMSLDSWRAPLHRFGHSMLVRRRRTRHGAAQAQAQQPVPIEAQQEEDQAQDDGAQGEHQEDIQQQGQVVAQDPIHLGLPDLHLIDYDSDVFFPDDE